MIRKNLDELYKEVSGSIGTSLHFILKAELALQAACEIEMGKVSGPCSELAVFLGEMIKQRDSGKFLSMSKDEFVEYMEDTCSVSVLYFAPEKIKDDEDIASLAISISPLAIGLLGNRARNDRDLALLATSIYGRALKFVGKQLKKDKEVVLSAIKQDGLSAMYADESVEEFFVNSSRFGVNSVETIKKLSNVIDCEKRVASQRKGLSQIVGGNERVGCRGGSKKV